MTCVCVCVSALQMDCADFKIWIWEAQIPFSSQQKNPWQTELGPEPASLGSLSNGVRALPGRGGLGLYKQRCDWTAWRSNIPETEKEIKKWESVKLMHFSQFLNVVLLFKSRICNYRAQPTNFCVTNTSILNSPQSMWICLQAKE